MRNKHIFVRFILGFAIGVLHGAMVVFFVSLGVNGINGDYIPAVPETVRIFGSENLAVIVQTLLTGFLGVAYAMAALVYENPRWSFLKQSLLQFLITFPYLMVVARICWVPEHAEGYISLVCSILLGYIVNFIVQYNLAKRDVREINSKMNGYVQSLEDNDDSDKN